MVKKYFLLVVAILMGCMTTVEAQTDNGPLRIVDTKPDVRVIRRSPCHDEFQQSLENGSLVPSIVLTKEGNILSIELRNYTCNCVSLDFNVETSVSEGSNDAPSTVSITVEPVTPEDSDCECTCNISFTVRDVETNIFYLNCWWYKGMVSLTEGEPLVLDSPEYFPVGTEWKEVFTESVVPAFGECSKNVTIPAITYKIVNDTLINGTKYKAVSANDNKPELWLREADNCVWLLSADFPQEIKIYDFNWSSGEPVQTEYVIEKEDGQKTLATETQPNNYLTVKLGSTTYQCYNDLEGTVICNIGRVSELNRNSSLLGYIQPEVVLPGLQYWKVLWIRQYGKTIFKSENEYEWTAYIPNRIQVGDVNSDGNVNSADVQRIYHLMANSQYTSGADVNGDGNINSADIQRLYSIMAGQQAQTASLEYEPMAQERRIWDLQVGGIKENRYENFILGDTLIGGEVWKKVYGRTLFGPHPGEIWNLYHMAMRDVGKKVYAIAKGSNKPRLLYDFGLQVGETVRCGLEGNAFACLLDKDEPLDTLFGFPINFTLRVERIDTVEYYGGQRRRFTLTLLDVYKYPMITNIVWDEGVGSLASLFLPWMIMPQDCAWSMCFFDDEEDPFLPTSIKAGQQVQATSLDYEPMAQERRIWEIQVGGIKENRYVNYVLGDTLINGDVWKKVYGSTLFGPYGAIRHLYHMAIRDVGKKVYAIAKGSNKPRLLYDFGLQVGETVRCGLEGNAFACLLDKDEPLDTLFGFPINFTLRVERIDTVEYYGQRRRFTLTLLDVYKRPMITNIVWDEGVGSSAGLFSPWMIMPQDCTSSECFFDDEEEPIIPMLLPTKVVGNNQPLPSGNSILFNLPGRRLTTEPQSEVYIRDGEKHVVK